MPTPCPSRLKELIALANLEPDSEARKHLQAIARAFKARKQRKAKAPGSIQIEIKQTITVLLDDGTIQAPRNALQLALDQIEPSSNIARIRECQNPGCLEIFWAGRTGEEACDRHTGAWSKSEWRRKTKEKTIARAKNRDRRAKRRAAKPFELTLTTATILDAICEQVRFFQKIDDYCWAHISGRSYFPANVISSLKLLEDLDLNKLFRARS